MLKLRYNWPKIATNCLHKSTTAKFYSFTESDKGLFEKITKTLLLDHLLYLQGKLLRTKLLFEIRQIGANLLSEMMLVSFIVSL